MADTINEIFEIKVEQQLSAEENTVAAAEAAEQEVQEMWGTEEAGEILNEETDETQKNQEQGKDEGITVPELADTLNEHGLEENEAEEDNSISSVVIGVPDGSSGVPFIPSKEGANKPRFTRRVSNHAFRGEPASNEGNDVFNRLYSHMTGTHKHGGRRAVANVHSTRLSSTYLGGAARGRSWLIQSEPDAPGPQDAINPHEQTDLAFHARRSHNVRGIGGMATSRRFRIHCSKGGLLSDKEVEEAAHRGPTRTHAELIAPGQQGKVSVHMGGVSDRFAARLSTGQFRSKRDLEEGKQRGAKHQQSVEVYSSFKKSAVKSRNSAIFGGSTDRFQARTASGIICSKRDLLQNNGNEKKEFTPVYSSFAKSSAPSKRSSYFGGSTSRFGHDKKKNGGLVTPGPGAFELTASGAKGFFGNSTVAPISLLA